MTGEPMLGAGRERLAAALRALWRGDLIEAGGAEGDARDLEYADELRLVAALAGRQRAIVAAAESISNGNLATRIAPLGDRDLLASSLNAIAARFSGLLEDNHRQLWLAEGVAAVADATRGELELAALAKRAIDALCHYLKLQVGTLYVRDGGALRLTASYAFVRRKHLADRFELGEGLVGQCAYERQPILLANVPADYVRVTSSLGDASPRNLLVYPLVHDGELVSVLELGALRELGDPELALLGRVAEGIATAICAAEARQRIRLLLEETRRQAEQLETQSEELRQTNEQLEAQASRLKESEEELQTQSEELRQMNEELEDKASELGQQKLTLEAQNRDLERVKGQLESKAYELEVTSRYKSEFLAKMSHELRTPLNSLLILSQQLSDNVEGRLSAKEVQYASTIHASGLDLLNLINEILDLAKIESGTVALERQEISVAELREYVQRNFEPIAAHKGLAFTVTQEGAVPDRIVTDPRRVQQILQNLLSNAIKFTERGAVAVRLGPAAEISARHGLAAPDPSEAAVLAFAVEDSGIGIPASEQEVIFRAFQQVDTGPSRRYGGTGLGLSISRQLAELLGGRLSVRSTLGAGSVFVLQLPAELPARKAAPARVPAPPPRLPSTLAEAAGEATGDALLAGDDRDHMAPGDRALLVIEDDRRFAACLLEAARRRGFKVALASDGHTGLALASELRPSAIVLDLMLPDVDGVIVLDQLKRRPQVRHIPVQVVSARGDVEDRRARQLGALGVTAKPIDASGLASVIDGLASFIDRGRPALLVVAGEDQQALLSEPFDEGDIVVERARSGAEALAALKRRPFDCVALHPGLPDMRGVDLLETLRRERGSAPPPAIVLYDAGLGGVELGPDERAMLRQLSQSLIIKEVDSLERLLDQTTLHLHRPEAGLPESKRRTLSRVRAQDDALRGKRVLVVDDDVRNIFAMSSLLERYGMEVLSAESGREALDRFDQGELIDVVLMDIMLPDMDGYEVTRALRAQPACRKLPILAVTAKAMSGDRDRCIAAGASDYIAKPVDPMQLVSLLRVWLYK